MIELRDDALVLRFPDVHADAVCRVAFQRTLRIPDDNRDYPLPPGLGRFPLRHVDDHLDCMRLSQAPQAPPRSAPEMGLAPGGLMRQKIHEDPHGFDAWDRSARSRCFVHILNSLQFLQVTGVEPPAKPPTARDYTEAGLPWFEHYGGDLTALDGAKKLAGLDSVAARRAEAGGGRPRRQRPRQPGGRPEGGRRPRAGERVLSVWKTRLSARGGGCGARWSSRSGCCDSSNPVPARTRRPEHDRHGPAFSMSVAAARRCVRGRPAGPARPTGGRPRRDSDRPRSAATPVVT